VGPESMEHGNHPWAMRTSPPRFHIGDDVEIGQIGIGLGIEFEFEFELRTHEGPSACPPPYPGGISADSPGSRSAPRVHVGKGKQPRRG
jgi:hypothetical protein